MKLSKFASIVLTTTSLVIFSFGVFMSQVNAQSIGVEVPVTIGQVEVELEPASSGGFGMVMESFIEDLKVKVNGNLEVRLQTAEKSLARIKQLSEAATGKVQPAGLATAITKYEERIAALKAYVAAKPVAERTQVLDQLAKHQAVLQTLLQTVPEDRVALMKTALDKSMGESEQLISGLDKNKQATLKKKLDTKKSLMVVELTKNIDKEEIKQRIKQRLQLAEEASPAAHIKTDKDDGSLSRDNQKAAQLLKGRVKEDVRKGKAETMDPNLKFKQRFEEKTATAGAAQKLAPMDSVEMRRVLGAIDFQPERLWEKLGYWLQGHYKF
jgi:hypothetical protein